MAFIYVLMILGCAYLFKFTIKKVKILTDGDRVQVLVTKIPNCEYNARSDYEFLKFNFNNKSYSKRLKVKYCKILEEKYFDKGKWDIELVTNKNRSIFLFPFEDLRVDMISFILIELIFIYCLVRLFVAKSKIQEG